MEEYVCLKVYILLNNGESLLFVRHCRRSRSCSTSNFDQGALYRKNAFSRNVTPGRRPTFHSVEFWKKSYSASGSIRSLPICVFYFDFTCHKISSRSIVVAHFISYLWKIHCNGLFLYIEIVLLIPIEYVQRSWMTTTIGELSSADDCHLAYKEYFTSCSMMFQNLKHFLVIEGTPINVYIFMLNLA